VRQDPDWKGLVIAGLLTTLGTAALARQAPQELFVSQQQMLAARQSAGTEPRLPMLAGAPGIRGPVLFEIEVSDQGRITRAAVLHGAPMLEQAASDALKTWQLRPITLAGRPAGYRTTAVVSFAGQTLDRNDQTRLMYLGDTMLLCLDAARQRAFTRAEKRFHLASNVAETLTRLDITLPVRANRLEAEALVEIGRHAAAIRLFQRVETRLRSLPFFSLDRTLSLAGLGRSYAALGQADEAQRAYGQAERQLYEAWDGSSRSSAFREDASRYYVSTAEGYLPLLERAGRSADVNRIKQRLDAVRRYR
jgi:TonB family protein